MAKILYITANPKTTEASFSLTVGEEFLAAYKELNPSDEIVHIDVYNTDIPLIDADVLNAFGKGGEGLTEIEAAKVTRYAELTDQFVAADKYVFVSPLWNFSIPPMLKAYIDTICVAGKTFKYTENGPVGLLGDKKAIHIQASGGVFHNTPMDFGNRYIETVFGFIGIGSHESILIEGMAMTPDQADAIKADAIQRAKEAAKRFAGTEVTA